MTAADQREPAERKQDQPAERSNGEPQCREGDENEDEAENELNGRHREGR